MGTINHHHTSKDLGSNSNSFKITANLIPQTKTTSHHNNRYDHYQDRGKIATVVNKAIQLKINT